MRSRRARRYRLGRDEAGHAGNRIHAQRAALHQRGRHLEDRYPHGGISDPRRLRERARVDVDKLKAILAALEGTDVTRLTWVSGQETLDLRLGHPPTAVHAVPIAAPMAAAVHAPAAANPHPPAAAAAGAAAPAPAAAKPA